LRFVGIKQYEAQLTRVLEGTTAAKEQEILVSA